MMQYPMKVSILVILFVVSIQTNNALTPKSYLIEADKTGTELLGASQWKFMKSQNVTFSECSVSKIAIPVHPLIQTNFN